MDQIVIHRLEKDLTEVKISIARLEEKVSRTLHEIENKDKEVDKLKVDMEAIKAWKYTSAGSIGLLIGLLIKI
jgi:peptidoglycan hydrolase CwlO-like protein